jgi:hypothetical protein
MILQMKMNSSYWKCEKSAQVDFSYQEGDYEILEKANRLWYLSRAYLS